MTQTEIDIIKGRACDDCGKPWADCKCRPGVCRQCLGAGRIVLNCVEVVVCRACKGTGYSRKVR